MFGCVLLRCLFLVAWKAYIDVINVYMFFLNVCKTVKPFLFHTNKMAAKLRAR